MFDHYISTTQNNQKVSDRGPSGSIDQHEVAAHTNMETTHIGRIHSLMWGGVISNESLAAEDLEEVNKMASEEEIFLQRRNSTRDLFIAVPWRPDKATTCTSARPESVHMDTPTCCAVLVIVR